jgi:molybdopterin-binding protein
MRLSIRNRLPGKVGPLQSGVVTTILKLSPLAGRLPLVDEIMLGVE